MPEFEAKRYEGLVRNGGVLLSVHADDSDWAERGGHWRDTGRPWHVPLSSGRSWHAAAGHQRPAAAPRPRPGIIRA